MTALEAYELTTRGGATDFARLIAACGTFGPLDADLVLIASGLSRLSAHLQEQGGSELRIRFTVGERYQAFLARSVESEVSSYPPELQEQIERG